MQDLYISRINRKLHLGRASRTMRKPFSVLTPNGLCLRSIGFRAWGGIELRFPVYLGFHGAVSRALGSGFVNVLKGSCRVKNKYWVD